MPHMQTADSFDLRAAENGTADERCPKSLVSAEVSQLAEDVTASPVHLTCFLPGAPSAGKGEREVEDEEGASSLPKPYCFFST